MAIISDMMPLPFEDPKASGLERPYPDTRQEDGDRRSMVVLNQKSPIDALEADAENCKHTPVTWPRWGNALLDSQGFLWLTPWRPMFQVDPFHIREMM